MKTFVRTFLIAAAVSGTAAPGIAAQSFAGAEQPAQLAGFGATIAFAGDQLLVTEPDNQLRPGLVYVYEQDDSGAWKEVQRIEGVESDLGDRFSVAMAVTGSTLFVSGPNGVETFERDAEGLWNPTGMLAAPADLAPTAGFGASLAASGDVLLVGAPGASQGTGAVFVYRAGMDGWSATGTMPAAGLQAGDAFGGAVAFDGERAAVGAPNRAQARGGVYWFAFDGSSFSAEGSTSTRFMAPETGMGASIALAAERALVGAPFANQGTGTVFVFELDDEGEWDNAGRLAAFDGGPQTFFGQGMAVVGDEIWIGGPGNNAVYVFEPSMDGERIGSVRRIAPEGASGRGSTTMGIAVEGSTVAVGFPGSGDGEVVVYDAAGGDWTMAGGVLAEPEELDPVAGGEVTCEEGEAVVWDCSDVDLVSFVPVSTLAGEQGVRVNTNDNWGWQDPETGRYYALVGMSDRASFVDITDAENPVVVGILHMTEGARPSAWRDIKTYENHAFIVSDGAGQHGMQVFDLSRLRDFDGGEPIVFDADALYTDIASAHNIVINEDSGYAFSVGSSSGGETCGGGLHIINIQDPINPTFAGCFSDPQTGRSGTGYTHDAQCVTYEGPDSDYQGREVCFGANETALSIADVTNKENTIAISNAAYPHVGYSHQGWLTEDHRFFFMNDELDEIAYWNDPEAMQGGASKTRTLIWDVTDLDDPQLVAEHLGVEESSDHNLYVVGDLMYQSNYRSGLRILDISDPAAPVEVAYFDTVPYGDNSAGMGGSWSNYPFFDTGMVIVTSGREGLFVVRPTIRRTVF